MIFSERNWFKDIRKIVQKESIDDKFLNDLWNMIFLYFLKPIKWYDASYAEQEYIKLKTQISLSFLWDRLDELTNNCNSYINKLKTYIFETEWYNIYDLIEFIIDKNTIYEDNFLISDFNLIFQKHLSAYRIVNWIITEVTSENEIKSIEKSIELEDKFIPVKNHIKRSLELLSNKTNPDYRNSIKESISAVESLCCIITWNKKSTLWDALKEISKTHEIHWSLKEAFLKLYWYSSDKDWIRHKLMKEDNLEQEDAMFMLVTCSSFINLLIAKIS